MCADLRALVGVEKALEQRAEDRRVDQAPVEARRGEQEADFPMLQRQRGAAVEQAAVEFENVLEVEVAAFRHVVEQARQESLGLTGLALGRLQQFLPQAVGQQLHAVGKKAEDELVDEMRDRLPVRVPVLQAIGDGLELVCSFLGELRARAPGAQFVRIVKDGAQTGEVDRVAKLFEFELVLRRNLVGPAGLDSEDVGVAGDMQRRVFESRGIAGELFQRLVEIALFLLVFPGEISLLPDIRPSLAAAGLWRALLEGEVIADRIVLDRGRMIEQPTEVDEMFLRRCAFGQRHRFPFADEFLRRHRDGGGPRRASVRLA